MLLRQRFRPLALLVVGALVTSACSGVRDLLPFDADSVRDRIADQIDLEDLDIDLEGIDLDGLDLENFDLDGLSDGAAPAQAAPCTDADTNLDPALPEIADHVEQTTGDLTGDGQPDEVLTYAIESGDTSSFYVRVNAASGYVVEAFLDHASAIAPVSPIGATSLGGQRDVVFVIESTGASAQQVALWALHDDGPDQPCALKRVTLPDATTSPLFPTGGTVGSASGLACHDYDGSGTTDLVVRTMQQSGSGYDWREQAWTWPDSGALQVVGEDAGSVGDAGELDGFGGLDCP